MDCLRKGSWQNVTQITVNGFAWQGCILAFLCLHDTFLFGTEIKTVNNLAFVCYTIRVNQPATTSRQFSCWIKPILAGSTLLASNQMHSRYNSNAHIDDNSHIPNSAKDYIAIHRSMGANRYEVWPLENKSSFMVNELGTLWNNNPRIIETNLSLGTAMRYIVTS